VVLGCALAGRQRLARHRDRALAFAGEQVHRRGVDRGVVAAEALEHLGVAIGGDPRARRSRVTARRECPVLRDARTERGDGPPRGGARPELAGTPAATPGAARKAGSGATTRATMPGTSANAAHATMPTCARTYSPTVSDTRGSAIASKQANAIGYAAVHAHATA